MYIVMAFYLYITVESGKGMRDVGGM